MNKRERIIIGMCGAVMPIIANLYFLDYSKLDSVAGDIISYLIRFAILLLVGGLVGYMHQETDRWKMFQLGLAVPSLMAAAYTGKALEDDRIKHAIEMQSLLGDSAIVVRDDTGYDFHIFPSAFAQTKKEDQLKKYKRPEQSVFMSAWQGITGSQPENVWHVVAVSYATEAEAIQKANEINTRYKDFKAEVFAPIKSNPHYSVVLGSNLALQDAENLRIKAMAAGVEKNVYLWSLK